MNASLLSTLDRTRILGQRLCATPPVPLLERGQRAGLQFVRQVRRRERDPQLSEVGGFGVSALGELIEERFELATYAQQPRGIRRAASGGLLALPATGVVIAVDAIALTTGLALTGHGALVLLAASNGVRNGRGDSGPRPAPETPAAFPDAKPARRKTQVRGGGGLRKRWTDKDGNILEWDSQHGAIEKYDRRGRHLGEFDPDTGQQTKAPDRSRRVEP